jgi:hypothetical protein
MRPAPIGIALAADRIATTTWSRPLAPRPPGAEDWEDLRGALVELRERLAPGVPGASRSPGAAIALLPPLAQARVIELPPLRPAEYRRILTRDAARYFPTGRVAQLAAGVPLAAGRSPVPVLAATAASDLIDVIVRAVAAAGWRLDAIVPAAAAWLRGAPRPHGILVVPVGATVEVWRVADGVPTALRRLPGAPQAVAALVAELAQEGEPRELVHDPLGAAAAGVVRARGPELVPDQMLAARRHRLRYTVTRLAAAAVVLLIAAAGFDWWGAERQLGAIARRRAALGGDVAVALARQDSVEHLVARHATLERAAAAGVRWSEVLADVTDSLPRDAYLIAFRGRGDSVGLEGVAQHAASVFAALARAPRVAGLRADAPIRQEVARGGGPPIERFAVAARLATAPERQP